jgi:hypothetical protein
VYNIVHSFNTGEFNSGQNHTKTMQLAGGWNDMPANDFNDMMDEIKRSKEQMFNRKIDL